MWFGMTLILAGAYVVLMSVVSLFARNLSPLQAIAGFGVGIATFGLGRYFNMLWQRSIGVGGAPDRQERVRRLARSLDDLKRQLANADLTIDEIRAEVDEGARTLEELERRVADAQLLATVSDPQAAAIRAALHDSFRTAGRRPTRGDIMVNTFFFVLGLILSQVFGR